MERNIFDESKYNSLFTSTREQLARLSPSERTAFIKQFKNSYKGVDNKFIHAVLFPETSPPARWPIKYASQQTALFTHRFHTYCGTGNTGAGFITLLPKVANMPCLFTSTSDVGPGFIYDGNPSNGYLTGDICASIASNAQFIALNYSQVRLVGCSIRLQYIGPADTESGMVVASHTWEHFPVNVSDERIENGYYVHRGRPSEGKRLVWLPKDNADSEFYGSEMIINPIRGGNWDADNGAYRNVSSNEYFGDPAATNPLRSLEYQSVPGTLIPIIPEVAGEVPLRIGMGQREGTIGKPESLNIYWKGLPGGNQVYWRIDVERHFEGVPRTAIRDIVSTDYPKSNPSALDIVLSPEVHNLPVSSHSAKEGGFWTTTGKSLFENVIQGAATIGGDILGGPVAGAVAGAASNALMNLVFGNDAKQQTLENRDSTYRGSGGLDHYMGKNGTQYETKGQGDGYFQSGKYL